MTSFLSHELSDLSDAILQMAAAGPISRAEAGDVALALVVLADFALKVEQELTVHRMMREGAAAMRLAEIEAEIATKVVKSDGNVITPDFGRGA
jgi:Mg-chelatase subunit ChlD